MEGVTLMESGTTRSHFAFLKHLEAAKDATKADEIILKTIEGVQSDLMSKSAQSWSSSSLTSHLLLLLHCIDLYPSSSVGHKRPSIQSTLVPALHLAAVASGPKELYIAYAILGSIFADQSEEEKLPTSLLLLDTSRKHLEATSAGMHDTRGRTRRQRRHYKDNQDSIALVKTSLALKSIIAGVPAGPDIFPALYNPISLLCHHEDESIQRLALDALGKIQSYIEHDEGISKAVWERVRGMTKEYKTRRSDGSRPTSDSLGRALLRAVKRALHQGVLTGQAACKSIIELVDIRKYPALSITCLEYCVDIAARSIIQQSILKEVCKLAAEVCLLPPSKYSTLLSGVGILGRLASLDTSMSSSLDVKPVWLLIKSHFGTKNANRKLLLLNALEAFLPFSWYETNNVAGIHLEESEMAYLLAMLGDNDESIRLRSLQLFDRIDHSLLNSHLDQLLEAANKASGLDGMEARQLTQRVLEVASVRSQTDRAQYSQTVHDVLFLPSDGSLDDGLIHLVLRHIRASDASYGSQCLLLLLQKQQDSMPEPSPTLALLCASIACEIDCEEQHCNEIVSMLVKMLVDSLEQAALSEALVVAITKLVLCCKDPDDDILPSLLKARDANNASVVQHRLNRLINDLQDHGTTKVKQAIPSGSLLDTMDRLDAFFDGIKAMSTVSKPISATLPRYKPLHYEPYSESSTMSPSSSTSGNKSFSALPPPSLAQDSRTRRARKQKEDDVRMEMQKSIARLTLDTEYDDNIDEVTKDASDEAVLF